MVIKYFFENEENQMISSTETKVYDIKECIPPGWKEHNSGTANGWYYKILCANVLCFCFSHQILATFWEIKHRDLKCWNPLIFNYIYNIVAQVTTMKLQVHITRYPFDNYLWQDCLLTKTVSNMDLFLTSRKIATLPLFL